MSIQGTSHVFSVLDTSIQTTVFRLQETKRHPPTSPHLVPRISVQNRYFRNKSPGARPTQLSTTQPGHRVQFNIRSINGCESRCRHRHRHPHQKNRFSMPARDYLIQQRWQSRQLRIRSEIISLRGSYQFRDFQVPAIFLRVRPHFDETERGEIVLRPLCDYNRAHSRPKLGTVRDEVPKQINDVINSEGT